MIRQIDAPAILRYPSNAALRVLPAVFALGLHPAHSLGERILDQMRIVDEGRYAAGYGNHSGGLLMFGKNYSLELCDDFVTTSTGYVITEVEVGNLTFGLERPTTAWVSIYEVTEEGGPMETALYDARHEVTVNTPFEDRIFGLAGWKTAISALSISLSPNTRYYISVQTESGDWAYTAVGYLDSKTANVRIRDNGRNGYQGGYGFTTWRASRSLSNPC
jgi:hypothetical protein